MDWLTHFAYGGVALALLLAGFGVPIPEDIPLLTGGYLCYLGRADLYIMIPMVFVCVLTGDFTVFTLGRCWGDHVLEHRWMHGLVGRRRLEVIKERYRRHGAKIVFIGRFMPGMRSVIFTTAGIVGIPYWKFALVNGSAAMISVPTLVLLGWYFGAHFDWVRRQVREGQIVITVGVVAAVLALIVDEYWAAKRRKRENGDDVPVSDTPLPGQTAETRRDADGAAVKAHANEPISS